jgi:hypothetical protein
MRSGEEEGGVSGKREGRKRVRVGARERRLKRD